MINRIVLYDVLKAYKLDFISFVWSKEKYKWEAVKCFQDNWDINAPDFTEMLERVLDKTGNLLVSKNNFPKGMLLNFAAAAPQEVRAMFIALFDESVDVFERIEAFKLQASVMLDKYGNGAAQHYQRENAISTYLWLRYPDKYYIYKYGEINTVSDVLECDCRFKKGAYSNNMRSFLKLYDEISLALKDDSELVSLLRSQLTDTCYPDPELKTLTIDVGFYISRYYSKRTNGEQTPDNGCESADFAPPSDEWSPTLAEYTPGFSKEQWLEILNNDTIIESVWGGVLAAFYGLGGAATCKQVALKYNKTTSAIIGTCTQLAKCIRRETGCPVYTDKNGANSYWPILFQGKSADSDTPKVTVWKLRAELYDTLTEFDIMRFEWQVEGEPTADDGEKRYWWLNANPKIWSFSSIGIGEAQCYTLLNENGNKRRIFQNFLDAKCGDAIICYESNPVKQIVAIGRVLAEQDGEKLRFEKVESLVSPIDYAALKACPELENMEFFTNPNGSLFKLTKEEYDLILDMIREENPIEGAEADSYTKSDFLRDVYMTEERYERLAAILRNKKNIILQGAPGVGKTFAAKRLAWSIMGAKDDSRIEFVQFHQNYSYEDFIMGYRPVENGFELKHGIFYRFCLKAANQPGKEFFFIIDEINRGNLSKIFGELLMLIEKDYRNEKATLAYTGCPFSVPKNLYIIGMMNTADRSLAMIDYALRRRFSFFDMEPGFDSEGFIRYQNGLNNSTLDELVSRVRELNREISLDRSLGKGFCIGHSYFCGMESCSEYQLRAIVDYDIIPMLSEYWFDEDTKLRRWENILRGVFQ